MKKNIFLFMSLLVALISCKDDEGLKRELKVTPNNIVVWAEQTTKSLYVETNTEFTVNTTDKWIKILNAPSDFVKFEVSENTTKEDRIGKLKLISKDKSVKEEITLIQKATKSLNANSNDIMVWAEKTVKILKLNSKTTYDVKEKEDWIKVIDSNSDGIKIELSENTTKKDRVGEIKLVSTDTKVEEVLKITQKAVKSILIEETVKRVPFSSGKYTIPVKSKVDYTVKSNVNWIIIEESTDKIVFSVGENTTYQREQDIELSYEGNVVTTLKVIQAKSPKPESRDFILPFLGWGKQDLEIKKYEGTRTTQTELENEKKNDASGVGDSFTLYTFKVLNDPLFKEFKYIINLKGYQIASAYLKKTENKGELEELKDEFETFLVKSGYKKVKGMVKDPFTGIVSEKERYVNEKTQTNVEFKNDRFPFYYFTYAPFQQVDLKTLSELPKFEKWKSEIEVLKSEDDDPNSTFNAQKSDLGYKQNGIIKDRRYYDVVNGAETLIGRTHWIYKSGDKLGLVQSSYIYQDPTLAFYGGLDGEYRPSKEFEALLNKEGYVFASFSRGRYYYYKNGDSRQGSLRLTRYKDKDLGYVFSIEMW